MNFALQMALSIALPIALPQTGAFDLKLPAGLVPAIPAPAKVLVTVGGVPIRAQDVQPYLWDWASQGAVQELVSYQIVAGEAAKLKVSVADTDVAKAVRAQMEQYRQQLPPGTNLDSALREKGFSPSRLHIVIKTDLLLEKITMRDFKPEGFVKVATIVVKPASESVADLGTAIQLAQSAHERLKKGETWSKVLADVVKDENAKKNDGLLGWRSFEAFPAATQKVLRELPVGGLTEPVQTSFGLQIFRVLGQGKGASGEDAEQIKAQFLGTARAKVLNRLRQDVKIVWSK
ncbi:MAG: peptidylprolyl isomerase [Fimbriimonas sp.]